MIANKNDLIIDEIFHNDKSLKNEITNIILNRINETIYDTFNNEDLKIDQIKIERELLKRYFFSD